MRRSPLVFLVSHRGSDRERDVVAISEGHWTVGSLHYGSSFGAI